MEQLVLDHAVRNSMQRSIASSLRLENVELVATEMSFVGVDGNGRAAFELPRWVDAEIDSGIKKLVSSGEKNLSGRCTWGSLRYGKNAHVPVVVVALGSPNRSIVVAGVCSSFWNDSRVIEWLGLVLSSSSIGAAGRNSVGLPDLFLMPKVMLWDGNRDVLPRMLGYTFEDSVVASGALSRMYWPLDSLKNLGQMAVESRHQAEAVGTLHLTTFEEGFLVPSVGGGWMTN